MLNVRLGLLKEITVSIIHNQASEFGYKNTLAQLHPQLHQGSDEEKDIVCVFFFFMC